MAKGQKRTSKEIRKPKAVKAPVVATASSILTKGMLTPIKETKKK
jgi:pseudouridine-5'-phosphate glycosidase